MAEYIKSYPNDIYNLNNYQPDWIQTDENKFRLQYRNKTYIVGNTNNKVWVWLNGKFINHLFPKQSVEEIKNDILDKIEILYPDLYNVNSNNKASPRSEP